MNPILEPLTFKVSSKDASSLEEKVQNLLLKPQSAQCLLCSDLFNLPHQRDALLCHLLLRHKLVIADVKEIADLNTYLDYWREKFALGETALKLYCFAFTTDVTHEGGIQVKEEYFMLADDLPEDKDLRAQLQKERLQLVLEQQKKEREENTFSRLCLFCRKTITGNRKDLLEHMNFDHNFSIGQADNIVFVDDFLDILETKLDNLECLYCERVFKDRTVLKEHMRKKQHKKINSENHFYDKFYVVNYLEPGKTWKEIMVEKDDPSLKKMENDDAEWSDWQEDEQLEVVCLFCQFRAKILVTILEHMVDVHKFNLPQLSEKNRWNYYHQVKIVNYARRQFHENKCIYCDEQFDCNEDLQTHLADKTHSKLPQQEIWDQVQFYFPTYENDALLYFLEEGINASESQIAVIPEDQTPGNSILQEESVRKELL